MKLYKIDSKGKTRVWFATAEGNETVVTHGLHGGSLITERTVCTEKNVGKANYISAEDQAIKEVAALYAKKQARDGYTDTPGGSVSYIQPMLSN